MPMRNLFSQLRRTAGVLSICLMGLAGVGPLHAAEVTLVDAYPGLWFDGPLWYGVAPSDAQHAFVATQKGVIHIFDDSAAATSSSVFLDISDRVTQVGGELGLLGMAFDPSYASNGYFYVNYIPSSGSRRTRIARFQASSATRADPNSETVLLEYDQPYANHNGGWLGFGPDGKLYIAAGDGGSAGDPDNNAQRLDTVLGKILRINSNGSIPSDNPFTGVAGARGEIWALGLRNPFRASFDRWTGQLWAGDVGQNEWEEIDIIQRGGNYGWSRYEGNHLYNGGVAEPANPIFPVAEYDHNNGRCSIQGGYVYRGSAVAALSGRYVYADYCSGEVWALSGDAGAGYSSELLLVAPGNPTSFGEGQAGEVFLTAFNGHVYRFSAPVTPPPSNDPPALLSQTGLFASTATLTPSSAMTPYEVNAPFWSDNAIKSRWIALPVGTTMGFDAESAWTFPVGMRLVKHFEMDLADGSRTRLETRVIERTADGWRGYTYRWRSDQLDADLLTEGATTQLQVIDDGQVVSQTYEFPSSTECLSCHTSAAGYALGVTTDQLNGRATQGAAVALNQLRYFDAQGYFSSGVAAPYHYDKLPDPYEDRASIEDRARAYLNTNCAQCHRPGGPTPVNMDLRYDTALEQTQTVGVEGTDSDLAPYRIAPGSKEDSLIWQRMRVLDDQRMPPLGSHVVDDQGVDVIGRWIDSLGNRTRPSPQR